MEEVGVEAVVKGLQTFLGDMRKVNSALDGLRPTGTLLQQMFDSIGSSVAGFGREVLNVVETTLGVMLRDAIEFAIGKIGELIQAIIEAGTEFQTLKIRLTGLNLNDFADGTRSFGEAMDLAQKKTQEELGWLQNLGAATPFDPAQIADTYTQARAFGFAGDEAKRLTTDIINYTAGMGLSNETLFLVIQNLGQMVQRGKITGTEIRDLARGSFLPLSDVLDRISKNMGITVKELTQRISTPEGIPAQEFVKAFEQMVEEEPRFVGAAGRLSRALIPASQNVKELFTSIFGLNVATPVFDILGEKVAGLIDEFVYFNEQGELIKTGKWENLVTAATNLGKAISGVVQQLLGFIPTSDNLADGLINGIQGLAFWIRDHQPEIVAFFVGIANAVNTYVIEPFKRIYAWVAENLPLIFQFFQSLGEIVSTVFGNLFGGEFAKGDFLGGVLEAVKGFMQFVVDNKDTIAEWATNLIKVFIAIELLITAFNIFITVVGAVLGFILGIIGGLAAFVGTVLGVVGAISFLVANFVAVLAILGSVIVIVGSVIAAVQAFFTLRSIADFIRNQFALPAMSAFDMLKTAVLTAIGLIVGNILGINWTGLGASISNGIAKGISSAGGTIAAAAVSAARNAYNAAKAFLGIRSPSRLFMDMGEMSMRGMAEGIQKYAGMAAGAMTSAMQQVAMPAISTPAVIQSIVARGNSGVTNNNDTRNFNLTVNSGANSENVIQDFNMLSSLSGA